MTKMTSKIMIFALLLCPVLVRAEDWPQLLGPGQNGTSTETNLFLSWPPEGPKEIWRRDVGNSYSPPVVSRDQVVLFHRLGDQEVVELLNAADGKTLWRHAYDTRYEDMYGYSNGPRAAPVIADETVFTYGAEGVASALDLKDGRLLWRRPLNQEYDVPQNFFGVGTSPIMIRDLVVFLVGATNNAGMVALDVKTGKTRWTAVAQSASYASPVSRSIGGRDYVLALMREGFVMVDAESGTERFSFPFRARVHESVNAASPVCIEDQVFLSSSYRVGAAMLSVAGETPRVVWQDREAMENHWATSIHHEGYLYGYHGRHESESRLRCIRAQDGAVQWTADQGLGRATLLKAENHFIALGERGALALIEIRPDRYVEKRRAQLLDYPSWAPPALSNKRLFLRSDRLLLCLSLDPDSQK